MIISNYTRNSQIRATIMRIIQTPTKKHKSPASQGYAINAPNRGRYILGVKLPKVNVTNDPRFYDASMCFQTCIGNCRGYCIHRRPDESRAQLD